MFRRLLLVVVVLGLATLFGFLAISSFPYIHSPWLTRGRGDLGGLLWWLAIALVLGVAAWWFSRPKVK